MMIIELLKILPHQFSVLNCAAPPDSCTKSWYVPQWAHWAQNSFHLAKTIPSTPCASNKELSMSHTSFADVELTTYTNILSATLSLIVDSTSLSFLHHPNWAARSLGKVIVSSTYSLDLVLSKCRSFWFSTWHSFRLLLMAQSNIHLWKSMWQHCQPLCNNRLSVRVDKKISRAVNLRSNSVMARAHNLLNNKGFIG